MSRGEEPVRWERGLRLPEGPKRTMNHRKDGTKKIHQTQEPSHLEKLAPPTRKEPPKAFVPASPPTTNVWGNPPPNTAVPSLAETMMAQALDENKEQASTPNSQPSAPMKASSLTNTTVPTKTGLKSPWKTIPPTPSPVSLKAKRMPQELSGAKSTPTMLSSASPAFVPAAKAKTVWGVTATPASLPSRKEEPKEKTTKKAKKGKPKLKNIQLGDLVPKNHVTKAVIFANKKPAEPKSEDFPALSSSSAATPRPTAKAKSLKPKPKAPKPTSRTTKAPVSKPPVPKPQDRKDDEAFSLLRQFTATATTTTPGRQRIKPRKKVFTSLKKKVLEERLRRWKELHPEETMASKQQHDASGTTVQLLHYLDADMAEALEDEDEYEEIVQNLRDLAEQCGAVRRVFVPSAGGPVFCDFADSAVAQSAMSVWNGLVLGGQRLECKQLPPVDVSSMEDEEWNQWCLNPPPASEKEKTIIMLENALTEDDLEDEDCLEESLTDIRNLVARHGTVLDVSISSGSTVKVTYEDTNKTAAETLKALSQLVLGGQALSAKPLETEPSSAVEKFRLTLFLDNVLTDDDLEDEDALLESIEDLRELANAHGKLESAQQEGERTSKRVCLIYTNESDTTNAFKAFQGMVIGGVPVRASRPEEFITMSGGADKDTSDSNVNDENTNQETAATDGDSKVMYSGDKIIAERFAECKRVPKVLNQTSPRHYAKPSTNPDVKPLLQEMLAELMRLQKRAVEENNTKAKRRLVMGLREVARGIRSHKVKMVVMATNLDEYGVIDEKLQEIIDLAANEDVPIFYELTKRAMGKAIAKTIKIAVIGVQSAEGSHQQFKRLLNIAARP